MMNVDRRTKFLLLCAIFLSAFAQAADYHNSISVVTGESGEDADLRYSRRFNPVELSLEPGIFSLVQSGARYHSRHALYYHPAVSLSLRFPFSGFVLKPEIRMRYLYSSRKVFFDSTEPSYGGWIPVPLDTGTSSRTVRYVDHVINLAAQVNFEKTFDHLLFAAYGGLGMEFGAKNYGSNGTPSPSFYPSTGQNRAIAPTPYLAFGVYSGGGLKLQVQQVDG